MTIRRFLLSLLLATAAVGIGHAPAEAHTPPQTHFDATSFYICGATKQYDGVHVDYDWPETMAPGVVVYRCRGHQHQPLPSLQCFNDSWPVAVYSNGTVVKGAYASTIAPCP